MKRTLCSLASALSLMMFFGSHSVVRADDWDQKTRFTINQPISIPGHVVLPAGSYVIKRLNTINPAVQILDASETKVYTTVLPTLDTMTNPQDKPMITFEEMTEGNPVALKTWYYPGRLTAYDFNPETTSKSQ